MNAAADRSRSGAAHRAGHLLLAAPDSLRECCGRFPGSTTMTAGLVAHRNTIESPRRLAATALGIGFAVFLTISQVGLLIGFIAAAEHVILATGADLWVLPPAVSALEYPSRLERGLAGRIVGQHGVRTVEPLVVDFVDWRGPGIRSGVALIGARAGSAVALPVPAGSSTHSFASPIAVHSRNGRSLGITRVGDQGEIGGRRVEAARLLSDAASFLGSPYVFADLRDAQRMIGLPGDVASYLLVYAEAGADVASLQLTLARLLPEHDVSTSREFATKSSRFWLLQTGAGGGFVLTAVLGFVVGVVVVSQTLYTSVVNRQREYACLAAIGASAGDLRRIVVFESLMSGAIGGVVGLALSFPGTWAMQTFVVPWISVPWWLRGSSLALALVMAALAATAAVRSVVRQDPAAILRG